MSDRYAEALVAAAQSAILGHDRDGTITIWNRAAERVLGHTARDVVGRHVSLLFPPDRQDELAATIARVLHGELVPRAEQILVARDGARIALDVTLSVIEDAAAGAVGVSWICHPVEEWQGRVTAVHLDGGAAKRARDTGEYKRATVAALHLAALVQSSDDVIVSKDLNGIVQSWNPAAERLFGYSAEEMIGRSITTIVPAARLDEEAYVLGRIRAGLSVEHFETVRQAKDGGLVDISLTVSPIRDDTGHIVGASKIARDIREHKRLLEERRVSAANEEAARREVLEIQNRRIQEAARLKSEFVANMSHELRTPLNSLLGFAELLADQRFGPLPSRYQEFGRIMHGSAQHLLQLINDILDLAKVESGKIELQPEPVELTRVVAEATAILSGLANTRKLELTTHVDPSIGLVHLDPMRLKQVLYNYLSNAIKFTPEGGRVAVRVRPDTEDWFRIEIEDNGVGIRPEDRHRLFVEFQQLDASTAKKFGGSGLGLAITKRLVEAQGGTVGVSSAFGVGSTFFASLPRHVTARSAEIAATPPPRAQ